MELAQYFKSIVDADQCAVVICNLAHEIIYMNPAAIIRYENGVGRHLWDKVYWIVIIHNLLKKLKKLSHGLKRVQNTTEFIHFTMKKKIRTSI